MDYDPKYSPSTFYSNSSNPYTLDDYQPGCGLRRSNPRLASWRNNRSPCDSPCCQGPQINFHQSCNCSLRIKPQCHCCCRMLPSLYHKLLSAPYTKICKQKTTPKKSPPKQDQKENNSPIRASVPILPRPVTLTLQQPPMYQSFPPQPIPQPHPTYTIYQPNQSVYQQPVYQQPVYQQPVYQQPVHQPPPPYVIRNSVPQNQLSTISFQTIPMENTQKSIRVSPSPIQVPLQPSSFFQPRKPKPSIVVPQPIDPQLLKPRESKKEQNINLRETINKVQLVKQRPISVVSFVLPQQAKQNEVSLPQQKLQLNPNQTNFMAIQAQNFANLRVSQGQSQLSVSQQKSQQISYSSQISQSSKSESKQTVQRIQQVEQKSLTRQEESNNENKTVSGDEEIHIISEGEEESVDQETD